MKKHSLTANCETCGQMFNPRPYLVERGHGRFCGRKCSNALKMGAPEDRFWRAVTKTEECWNFKPGPRGYGRIFVAGKNLRAHRYSWELHFGSVPAGLFVCHRCDNPSCVRPTHLFLGTALGNTADMIQKGRGVFNPPSPQRGERHTQSKLTGADARRVKELWAKGGMTQKAIGAMFGISQTAAFYIIHGRNWSHID